MNQICQKYASKEPDKMEQLRALDASVEKKATAVSIAMGLLGTMILGIGMRLAMSDFGAILGSAYPLYNRTLKKERKNST